MDFSFVNVSGKLVESVCTTLFHSLWQGMLLAVFAGIVVMLTPKSSAKIRYNLLMIGLMTFCIAIAATFYLQLTQTVKGLAKSNFQLDSAGSNIPFVGQAHTNQLFFDFLAGHSNTIVLVWFLIVLARIIQLITGLHGVYELRRTAIFQIDQKLVDKVLKLASEMGIRNPVAIAESAFAHVPMVIGNLKPLILIPVGLLTALPPSAIDAILIHELAHIYRRDYMVNLLLNLLEVIFFFNPALLWLTSLIKTERENCCDDIAIAKTSGRTAYINALIACQEFKSANTYAMTLNGQKKHLLARVSRMLSKNNQSLNAIEKSLLAVCLIVAGLSTLAFSNVEKFNQLVFQTGSHVAENSDVIGKYTQSKVNIPSNKVPIAFQVQNSFDTRLDTSKCEIYLPLQINKYTAMVIKNGDANVQLLKQNGISYQVHPDAQYAGALQVDGKTTPVTEYRRYAAIIDSLAQSMKRLPRLGKINRRQDVLINRQLYQSDTSEHSKLTHKPKLQAPLAPLAELQKPASPANPDPIDINAKNAGNLVKQLTDAMLQDEVAKDNIKSFKLTASELIVNGKRIPEAKFKAFVDKNIGYFHNGATVYFNFDTKTVVN